MYEIRMQWILTWNEMKLHMHQYDVCRTNDCRYANVCKSQPLLDSYHKIFPSKLWTLQKITFSTPFHSKVQNAFLTLQTYLCIFAWNSTIWENIRPLFYYAWWFTGWFYSSWSSVRTTVRIYNIRPKRLRHFCHLNK